MLLVYRHWAAIFIVMLLSAVNPVYAGELPLLDAVQAGDHDKIKSILGGQENINAGRADGTTALLWAVYHEDIEAVDLLLQGEADPNLADDYGVTPLFMACQNGDAIMVKKLLQSGADPDRELINGETPLMACSGTGVMDGVAALLEYGANINASEHKKGQTALMWAVAEQHPDVVRILVSKGADVHARSRVIPELEPFVIDVPGDMTVWGSNYPPGVRHPEVSGGFTALHFAAQQGDVEAAKVLLEGGADVNSPHPEHGSALVIAIASGHKDMAVFLLENGADPNIRDAWGISPLHYALHEGVLILNNFMPSSTDKLGWERKNMPALVDLLLDYGADPASRIEYSYAFMDNPFLARGSKEMYQVSPIGATPLLLAAASGDIESMNILANVSDVKATTTGGATLFMLAAAVGAERNARDETEAIQAAKLALELGGGDVNDHLTEIAPAGPGKGMKKDGRTTLHFAVRLGWTEMIRFLVHNGANLEAEDRYGMTPLMRAMGDPQGLSPNPQGTQPYDDQYRRTNPSRKISELLLELGAKPYTGAYRDNYLGFTD